MSRSSEAIQSNGTEQNGGGGIFNRATLRSNKEPLEKAVLPDQSLGIFPFFSRTIAPRHTVSSQLSTQSQFSSSDSPHPILHQLISAIAKDALHCFLMSCIYSQATARITHVGCVIRTSCTPRGHRTSLPIRSPSEDTSTGPYCPVTFSISVLFSVL